MTEKRELVPDPIAKLIGYFLADLIWWEGQLQIKLGRWWRKDN